MIRILFFFVSLLASAVGRICGVGGGIIIKPALDATGIMSVGSISFLSGCTVLSMSVVSVLANRSRRGLLDLKISTFLGLGGIAGGFLGKTVFDWFQVLLHSDRKLGTLQEALLLAVTLAALLYTICAGRIRTHRVRNIPLCVLIGLCLGMISAFLGIGGGPINLTFLSFFFSMDAKKAAANSLYIIMLSQLTSLAQTLATRAVPSAGAGVLILMIVAGILGSVIGGRINRRIPKNGVSRLFVAFMLLVVSINILNIIKFSIA